MIIPISVKMDDNMIINTICDDTVSRKRKTKKIVPVVKSPEKKDNSSEIKAKANSKTPNLPEIKSVKRNYDYDEGNKPSHFGPPKKQAKLGKGGQWIAPLINQSIPDIMSGPVEARTEAVFAKEKFADLGILHPHLVARLEQWKQLNVMTEIQRNSIPPLLNGRDVLIKAQTGSGKTLAYALPMVQKLQARVPAISRKDGTFALVITPTRELATQTHDTFISILKPFVRIVAGLLIGGTRKKAQKASLRNGLNILIGTPKRILDHFNATASLHLHQLEWLVIDEADRLMEMGFGKDVASILTQIRSSMNPEANLQTVLLSATLNEGVEKLAGLTLSDPIHCEVASERHTEGGPEFAMPSGLKHYLVVVPTKLRVVTLAAFILLKCRYNNRGGKVIVFMATQDSVDFHHRLFKETLCSSGEQLTLPDVVVDIDLFRLHGNMDHKERQSVYRAFSECPSGVLITTDVASRGLDLAQVAWVVQYHSPGQAIDYIHRVGRTARAGGKGKALLFLQPEEQSYKEVLDTLGVTLEQLRVKEILKASLFHVKNMRIKRNKKKVMSMTIEESIAQLQHHFEDWVEEEPGAKDLAVKAYTSFIGSYASFSGEMRKHFCFKKLHLGHVAKSFCIRDPPKVIAQQRRRREDNPDSNRKRMTERPRVERSTSLVKKPNMDQATRNMLAEYGL